MSNEVQAPPCLFCDQPSVAIMLDADNMPFQPFGRMLRVCSRCQAMASRADVFNTATMLQEFANALLVRIAQGEQGVRFNANGNLALQVQRRVRTSEDLVDLFILGLASVSQHMED